MLLVVLSGYVALCTPYGWRVHNLTTGDQWAPAEPALCWLPDGSARLFAQCPDNAVHQTYCGGDDSVVDY